MLPWTGKVDWPAHAHTTLRDVVRTVFQYRQKLLTWKEAVAQLQEVTGLNTVKATALLQKTANSDRNVGNLCQYPTPEEAWANLGL